MTSLIRLSLYSIPVYLSIAVILYELELGLFEFLIMTIGFTICLAWYLNQVEIIWKSAQIIKGLSEKSIMDELSVSDVNTLVSNIKNAVKSKKEVEDSPDDQKMYQ